GRNAVGYLTESMHGAGSPQAQRIQIARQMQIEFKKQLAKELAGIEERKREQLTSEISDYFGRVFDTKI
ncbi:MAG: 4-hydroxybutyryl-CoA dehydratase, partial [Acidobacteria bacterium]|nr:4-hydroxybutyryl-CoA dehydratase [Acidobacteriota bacterium]